jgi:indolepyruvate ferredoxin oxidoreductase
MAEKILKTNFSLNDKYTLFEGRVIMSGIQALVRLLLDQHRADIIKGINTGTLVSGYRGSPVGTLDINLLKNKKLLDEHNVKFIPGVNEDLGATLIYGSQMAGMVSNVKYDGVLGMWYGKAPGVDRSGDIFRHANFMGVGKNGGVLAVAGDDPSCKSSTLPSQSEPALFDAMMPIFYPGNVQEILDLGRYAYEMSRYSGLWSGFKIVTDIADGFGNAFVDPQRVNVTIPDFTYNGQPWKHTQNAKLVGHHSLPTEKEIHLGRITAAKHFLAANPINKITVQANDDKIGIVTAGKTYYDLIEAFESLGWSTDFLNSAGIRVLKLGATFPIDAPMINKFSEGLDEIFVIEEKRSFIEMLIKEEMFNYPNKPLIIGKLDENNNHLVPGYGELTADYLAKLLFKRYSKLINADSPNTKINILTEIDNRVYAQSLSNRSMYFCSGCPHNTSTVKLPEGDSAFGGIGCHLMAMFVDDGKAFGTTHMGGEGAQWVGMEPFVEKEHMFQNIGDGTFFHSGSLALRQAIAAKSHITYKILYNRAVAMTGAQDPDGGLDLPELTKYLKSQGVSKVIVTTDDTSAYDTIKKSRWDKDIEIMHRDDIIEAQKKLKAVEGVTVLIHDQSCAANLRRLRKRGLVHEPKERIFINEAVCEGCGDCGVKSNCLSVQPIKTEYGRKTQIDQPSCNKDYSCVDGNCPSFIKVIPSEKDDKRGLPEININSSKIPEPKKSNTKVGNIFMLGIGGTGVVTVNQIISTAAFLENKKVVALDQTGLSQKGGSVVSHLKILEKDSLDCSSRVANGESDGYLVFDLLTGANPKNMEKLNSKRSISIISTSEIPTGDMVRSTKSEYPEAEHMIGLIKEFSKKNVLLNATELSEHFFGSNMQANFIVIGAAYQAGSIPIDASSIEEAININGVAVKSNTEAFNIGRTLVSDPSWVESIDLYRTGDLKPVPVSSKESKKIIDSIKPDKELRSILEFRVPELIAYQNVDYAKEYAKFVRKVYKIEKKERSASTLSQNVAKYLFKFMAIKDEYEVARLSLKAELDMALSQEFGSSAKVHYMLHPPFLKGLANIPLLNRMPGVKSKIALGSWFRPFYMLLKNLKFIRGTRFDIMALFSSEVRKADNDILDHYKSNILENLSDISNGSYEKLINFSALPDVVRGYEEVRLESMKTYYHKAEQIFKS